MLSVDYPAHPSGGPGSWVEVLAVAVVVLVALALLAQLVATRLLQRVRRDDADAAAAVAEVASPAAEGESPDLLAMRAAFVLRELLHLGDCAWEWDRRRIPCAELRPGGEVSFGAARWPVERFGLPSRGVARPLHAGGRSFGWVVMVPVDGRAVAPVRLRAAATVCDVLALALAEHHHPAIAGPSV